MPFYTFSYLVDKTVFKVHSSRDTARLGDFFRFSRGIELGKKSKKISDSKHNGFRPLTFGEHVTAFKADARSWIKPENNKSVFKNISMYETKPKLLIRRVAGGIISAIDKTGAFVLNTVYVAIPKSETDLYAWCAFLNSQTVQKLFKATYCHDDRLFPYIRVKQLECLPVPKKSIARLSMLGKKMCSGKGTVQTMEKINNLVKKAYE